MRRRRLIWEGRARARRAIFLAAFVETRHGPNLKANRGRLLEAGKPPKIAIFAAASRMDTILKNGRDYPFAG